MDKASDSESEGPGFETRYHQRPTEYKWIAEYVLVKSVGPKVLTPRSVRCRPRHLTRVLNYEAYVAVFKLYLRLEIGSRKRSNQTKPNQTLFLSL